MTDQSIEDASRREFEEWNKKTYPLGSKEISHFRWQAWQAARQSSQSEPVGELSMDYQGFGSYKQMKQMPEGYHKLYAAPQQAIPSGWKLVPIEPTEEMLSEIHLIDSFSLEALKARYKAMLEASPTAPIERDK
jgi:hypothetical protein